MIFKILAGVCLSLVSAPPKIANLGHIRKCRRRRFQKRFQRAFRAASDCI
nr:MAG TPA: hypothetical protein [Caudoviricetes sp.]DAR63866.1 MAG TPA: hypothetical protein [Caudoviricetes sp.]